MENTWVDFRAVKAAVPMQVILDHYQVTWLRKTGEELRGRCPIHKGEGTDTFHASLTKNAFQCFSCKARGNVLDFVAAMEHCSVREAAAKLAAWFSLTSDGPGTSPATVATPHPPEGAPEHPLKNTPLSFALKGIDYGHEYLAARGIDRATAELFGIGFFRGKGSMSGRVVIPIHNGHGELIAYAGRSTDGAEPRYKLPLGFHKALELFNLHRALLIAPSGGMVVLVEGFFGCIKVHQAGYPCVALMGSSLSAQQEDLLCQFAGVALLLDGDEAGRRAADDCLMRLGRRGLWVKAIVLPDGKQPDLLSVEELQQLVK